MYGARGVVFVVLGQSIKKRRKMFSSSMNIESPHEQITVRFVGGADDRNKNSKY